MPPREISRRPAYGPNSPVVYERGARTRQQIVDAARALFEERGYHTILVDDIAKAADVARATLYQYFESKEHIFVELVEDSGAALNRLNRQLGPLGPTTEGFANLRSWLCDWAAVFDRYSAMFVQWTNVSPPWAPTVSSAATVSRSQLVPGKTRTAAFIRSWPPPAGRSDAAR